MGASTLVSVDNVTIEGDYIAKAHNDEAQLVFGWANVSVRKSEGEPLTDHHSHQIDPAELEAAAYEFVLSYREAGDMHQGEATGALVESIYMDVEKMEAMGFPPDARPATLLADGTRQELDAAWWVGFHFDEATYNKVKSSERRMFSIQGRAVMEEIS